MPSSTQQPLVVQTVVKGKESFPKEIFVAAYVNRLQVSEFERVIQDSDGFYATADQLASWRMLPPQAKTLSVFGGEFFPLQGAGLSAQLDPQQQVLWITARPQAFDENILQLSSPRQRATPTVQTGAFLNHDFQWTHFGDELDLSGLMELGIFSKFGILTSRFVGRELLRSAVGYRLDTQLVRDFPGMMTTLAIGDSVSASGPWARQVHYAGVRWASKFSTQPGFNPLAMPALDGLIGDPSVVDIYVNNVRTAHENVQTGPFAIPNVPAMTGQGDIRLVITDVLGRQQVISRPYITTQELLRAGVSEYTYEAGTLRRGFGTNSGGYESFFMSGTHRRGFTDNLTLNFHGEVLGKLQSLGLGTDFAWLPFGELGIGAAVSQSEGRLGSLVYAHFAHKGRNFGYSGNLQWTNADFRQLGMFTGELPPRLTGQAQISHALRTAGSISIGFLNQQNRTFQAGSFLSSPGRFNAVTTSVNLRFLGNTFLTASANYSPNVKAGTTVSLTLVLPLEQRKTAMITSELNRNGSSSNIDTSQQLPRGDGFGYRFRASPESSRVEAGISAQYKNGTAVLEASRDQGKMAFRFDETGSVVWLPGHLVTSRWVDDSFALVEVPAEKNVRVFANNQFVTTTNRRGLAVIPRLVPYETNTVYLDDTGVPLDLQMDFSQKTVVAMPRSGVMVRFAASPIRGAVLELVTESGDAVPLGSEVVVNGKSESYQVALRGEVFIPELSVPAQLAVHWDGKHCEATVPSLPPRVPLPRIGPLTCK